MRKLLACLALVVLASCDSTGPNASIAGTYSLRTVNGAPLPYVISAAPDKYELLDDAITLTEAGTWTELGHERMTSGTTISTQAFTDAGTYSRDGQTLTFHTNSSNSSTVTAALSGSSITVTDHDIVNVYTK